MQKGAAPSINLAKNRGETFLDRFLGWALTVGRFLVILTEGVAMFAFLFRFGLDRQLVDLHDRIKQEEAIVALLKSNEATYRNLQDRLSLAKTIDSQLSSQITTFARLMQMIPSDLSLTNFTYSATDVHLEGEISSLTALDALVNKLKNYPGITSVSIDKIQNKSANGTLVIAITGFFKQKKGLQQQ